MSALAATARATGSRNAALTGVPSTTRQLVTWFAAEIPDNAVRDLFNCGGTDPRHNPLLDRGMRSPVMRDISDTEVISRDERSRHPLWNEFYFRIDLPHSCVCPIWRQGKSGLAVSVLRTAKQGPIGENERKLFRRLTKHWRNAAVLSRALKTDSARLLAGALDTVSIAAFILDGFGRVVAVTPAAENILRSGALLREEGGGIQAALSGETAALERAINCSLGSPAEYGRSSEFLLRGLGGDESRIRVSPLPHENDIAFGAAALVIVEKAPVKAFAQPIALQSFALTAAELEVAGAVLAGEPVRNIARARNAAYETVRAQIKSIYSKAGVRNRAEFMAWRKT